MQLIFFSLMFVCYIASYNVEMFFSFKYMQVFQFYFLKPFTMWFQLNTKDESLCNYLILNSNLENKVKNRITYDKSTFSAHFKLDKTPHFKEESKIIKFKLKIILRQIIKNCLPPL